MGTSKLVFKIAKDGGVVISGEGFQGGKCLKEAEAFMASMGKVTSQELKSEFYSGGGQEVEITN